MKRNAQVPPIDSRCTRRDAVKIGLKTGLTGIAAGATLLSSGEARAAAPKFSFVHITDTHIQPELDAVAGVKKAFRAIKALPQKPAFGLVGGDIVMDTAYTDKKRAELLYDLWQQAASELGFPLYYTVGNHDVWAIGGENKVAETHPDWGKKWWMKRLGLQNRYGSFTHQGWKFFLLDSVGVSPDKWWGEVDIEQMNWLDGALRKTDRKTPVVALTHIPILTTYGLYTSGTTTALNEGMIVKNGKEVMDLLHTRNLKAVLQGHTHVVEECRYRGASYITGGAVCGEWWKGKRLGIHPEGFTVCTVSGDTLSSRYVPYGWTPKKSA
ncbi:MAG: hypothetical protein OHK0029_42450 [Armatimonadaceae bacterium]